jgi:hypothetical protein
MFLPLENDDRYRIFLSHANSVLKVKEYAGHSSFYIRWYASQGFCSSSIQGIGLFSMR